MSKTTPLGASRKLLEGEGFLVATVERHIPRCFRAIDLFGFADLAAIRGDRPGVLAVQTTTTAHQADRLAKAVALPALRVWLAAGNALEIHGWRKGRRSGAWELTRRPVTLADVEAYPDLSAAPSCSRQVGHDPDGGAPASAENIDPGRTPG
jgi:hypothetical protein